MPSSIPTTSTFSIWYVILIGILVFWALIIILRKRKRLRHSLSLIFLKISIPQKEDMKDKEKDQDTKKDFKETVSIMEQLFASFYSMHKINPKTLLLGQDYFSLEYAAVENELFFYVVVPKKLQALIEKQITSYYPDALVERVRDYNVFSPGSKQAVTTLVLKANHAFPIRTYQKLESDPVNSITNALSKLHSDEGASIQLIIKPVGNRWRSHSKHVAKDIYHGKEGKGSKWNPFTLIGDLFGALVHGPDDSSLTAKPEDSRITPAQEEKVKTIEAKASKVAFKTVIRIVTSSPTREAAQASLDSIASAFSQFNDPELNTFKKKKIMNDRLVLEKYIFRSFYSRFNRGGKPLLLNTEELASIFHFPNITYNKAPTIHWQKFKIAPAPHNTPKEGLFLGNNIFRGETRPVYMNREDRFRHFYVIGQTGTGKSTIFANMIRQDLKNGDGIAVIDPHGDLINDVLPFIPKKRADDVIYFNPADTARPMGLNLLEAKTPEERDFIALEAMNIMIKLFGEEIFSPRLQDYFRNGCLTLMEDEEEGGAITDIVRLFTDDAWQRYKVAKVKNPIVKSFWTKQMAATGAREKQEMIPYFAAKFGAFVTNTTMRNIVGQTKSSFDFGEVMQGGKILLVNLSKGAIGDLNSSLLGMIMTTKLQVAAMRRGTMPKDERRDFFLYIDEFQNFVTESIESILSEARKYRLGLNIAHQYLAQLEKGAVAGTGQKDAKLRDAVFGNVGTIMLYKIGAQDAEYLAKEMSPVFSEQDLINIDKYKAVIKLSIENQPSRPFSLIPLDPRLEKGHPPKVAEAIKQLSRLKYGRDREFVNREILARIGN